MPLGVPSPTFGQQTGTTRQPSNASIPNNNQAAPYKPPIPFNPTTQGPVGIGVPGSGPVTGWQAPKKINDIINWVTGGGNTTQDSVNDLLSRLGMGTADATNQAANDMWDEMFRRFQEKNLLDQENLRNSINASGASNALARQQLDIQRAALDRQLPLIDKLEGYRGGLYNNEDDFIRAMEGFTRADYDRESAYIDQLTGFAGEERDLSTRIAEGEADMSTRKARSSAAASGSNFTKGNRQDQADIQTILGNKKEGIGLQYRQTTSGLEKRRGDALSQRDQTLTGYTKRWNDNYFQRQIDKAQTEEERNKIRDQQAIVDLQAQQLNVSAGELSTRLQNGLKRLQLDQAVDLDQLLAMVTSNDDNERATGTQLWQQILGAG